MTHTRPPEPVIALIYSCVKTDLPLPDLAALVHKIHAPAVVLVAMVERTAENLIDWPSFFPEAKDTGRPAVVFGGTVFSEQPEWREKVPGVFLGASLREGVQKLDALLRTPQLPPK